MMTRNCRFCQTPLKQTFVDLGMSPISNAFLKPEQLNQAEKFYPLHAYVCENCFLVQLEEFETPDAIFSDDYAYFSSYSETFLCHAENYTQMMIERFGFNSESLVVEIASNDGYLLQYFQKQGVRVLGIEPAANVARVAESKGIPSWVKFFGTTTAQEIVRQKKQADLLIGNNVLAHVPDINDFVAGMKLALNPNGILTMEFPHLLKLMEFNQFDTIYHEHFSYLSLLTVENIFASHGLTLFDVEEIPTHGGSLRIYGKHDSNSNYQVTERLNNFRQQEIEAQLNRIDTYLGFAEKVRSTKRKLLQFLIKIKSQGQTIVGYGAPAKGNTLLNYCSIGTDFIDYTVDRSPHKQGLFLPGTHIPIYHPDKISETRPDYVVILPWNIKDEIIEQMAHIKDWGGQFLIPIPQVEVVS